MVDPNTSLEDLLRDRHPEIEVWMVTLRPVGTGRPEDPEDARELFRRHLLYWWDLEQRGVLLAAGPVDIGTPDQHGLAFLLAPSRQEAERIAHDEPFHAAGHRVNSVHTWQLNEGLVVDFVQRLGADGAG
jgi:uncharacterized protein YciI